MSFPASRLRALATAGCLATATVPALGGGDVTLGRQVFTDVATPACAVCHTLAAAGAQGNVGPSLDELRPDAERVARAVTDGFEAMPAYRGKLTEEQIRAVAAYVASVAGGAVR